MIDNACYRHPPPVCKQTNSSLFRYGDKYNSKDYVIIIIIISQWTLVIPTVACGGYHRLMRCNTDKYMLNKCRDVATRVTMLDNYI